MTRRTFLGLLPTAPVAVPAAVRAVASEPWRVTQLLAKEFDYGNALGIGMSVRNVLTGKTLRHGVRYLTQHFLLPGEKVWSPQAISRWQGEQFSATERGVERLEAWRRDLNAGIGERPGLLARWLARRRP